MPYKQRSAYLDFSHRVLRDNSPQPLSAPQPRGTCSSHPPPLFAIYHQLNRYRVSAWRTRTYPPTVPASLGVIDAFQDARIRVGLSGCDEKFLVFTRATSLATNLNIWMGRYTRATDLLASKRAGAGGSKRSRVTKCPVSAVSEKKHSCRTELNTTTLVVRRTQKVG